MSDSAESRWPSLVEIIEFGLVRHGYDGLVQPGVCGCLLGDLSPANCVTDQCCPGYRYDHSKKPIWAVGQTKMTDEEIEECYSA